MDAKKLKDKLVHVKRRGAAERSMDLLVCRMPPRFARQRVPRFARLGCGLASLVVSLYHGKGCGLASLAWGGLVQLLLFF
jgi:hypothetical protein